MVLVYHFSIANYVAEHWSLGTRAAIGTKAADFAALLPIFSMGWVGVDIFFVISGFVIALSAEGRSVRSFIQSRILRLYPVIVIATIIAFLVSVAYAEEKLSALLILGLKQLLLVPKGPWLDGVFWTLIVEIAFYSAIALIIFLKSYHRIEWIAAVWGCVTSAVALAALLSYAADPAEPNGIYTLAISYSARITLIATGPYFIVGVLTYVVAVKGLTVARAALLGLCSAASLVNIYLACTAEEFYAQGYYSCLIPMTAWAVAVIGITCTAWLPRLRVSNRRLRTIVRSAGLMTFPLYLIHNTLGAYALGLLIRGGIAPYPAFCGAMLLTLLASYVISRFAEPVLQSAIRRHVFTRDDRLHPPTPIRHEHRG